MTPCTSLPASFIAFPLYYLFYLSLSLTLTLSLDMHIYSRSPICLSDSFSQFWHISIILLILQVSIICKWVFINCLTPCQVHSPQSIVSSIYYLLSTFSCFFLVTQELANLRPLDSRTWRLAVWGILEYCQLCFNCWAFLKHVSHSNHQCFIFLFQHLMREQKWNIPLGHHTDSSTWQKLVVSKLTYLVGPPHCWLFKNPNMMSESWLWLFCINGLNVCATLMSYE